MNSTEVTPETFQHLVLVRHGPTPWSRSGQHTGRTDLPLDDGGRVAAAALAPRLDALSIREVLTSPLSRALETCQLAGLGEKAQVVEDLMEWDYGDYEGRTTREIRAERPHWDLFADGCPGGETPEEVEERARQALSLFRIAANGVGAVVIFSHGHLLRVLAACYLGFGVEGARLFTLDAASISQLGRAENYPVIRSWNT